MPKTMKRMESISKGDKVRVITDLLCSTTYRREGKLYIESDGRVYSVKGRNGSKWLLKGNSCRVLMKNVSSTTQEGARLKVLASGQKSPHSFLDGDYIEHQVFEDNHKAIIEDMLSKGAKYLSYDPYKVKGFVLIDTPHLPKDCSELVPFQGARLVYCYEETVLCLL